MSDQQQYLRRCDLIVSSISGDGLDLSGMRITFAVKKSDAQTPNTAVIRIYNLAEATQASIRKEFTQVLLQAGYDSNYGVIFAGTIKQTKSGREHGTETYLDLAAGDGDAAYNFSVVNTTLSAGAQQTDQVNASLLAMVPQGVTSGSMTGTTSQKLPRGKVLYGMARDTMRKAAKASGTSWSIQDGRLQLIPLTGVLPTQAVVLSSKTGVVGTPEQTEDGIKIRCLLNPLLKIGGTVQIDEQQIAEAPFPETTKANEINKKPVSIEHDGLYRILTVTHSGDTRGGHWYSDLVCLGVDASLPPGKSVKLNG